MTTNINNISAVQAVAPREEEQSSLQAAALNYAYHQVLEAVGSAPEGSRGVSFLLEGASFEEQWNQLTKEEQEACFLEMYKRMCKDKCHSSKEKDKDEVPANLTYFILVQMLNCLEGTEKSLIVKAGELEANSKLQREALESLKDKDFEYHTIPDGASKQVMDNIQIYNQQVDQRRSLVQSYVITLRQNGSVGMTETNAMVNGLSQKGSMISSFLKALESIAQEINSINKR